MQLFFVFLTAGTAEAQIYQHNFGTTTINAHPYTVTPTIMNANLSGSTWTNSANAWTSFGGSSGQAIVINSVTGTATLSLTFTVAPNYEASLSSFNFWRQRSNSGPQDWSMTINGIAAGNGTTPASGTVIGDTPLGSAFSGLTGTVTVTITLTNGAGGNFRLDDFTLNGTVVSTCATAVSTFTPASGPAGTIVTMNGANFTGTTSVKFGNVNAANFTVISNTQIQAEVPVGAASGTITVANGCNAVSSQPFSVITSTCTSGLTEIFISELYDEETGSGGIIELYNPTGSTIAFNGNYVLQRYGNITDTTPTAGYILTLTGSIGPGMTYQIAATNPGDCTVASSIAMSAGFNGNDKFELLRDGIVIDVVHVPYTDPGYTMIRKPNAIAPAAVYNDNDWNSSPAEDCSTVGSHSATPVIAPAVTQPESKTICENNSTTFSVSVNPPAGFTYQWKVLNTAGIWVDVVNNANYSGAATNTLSVTQVPAAFNNNQYYCEITSVTCTIQSNAAQLYVLPALAAPVLVPIQPTCAVPTGTITITAPTGAGLNYSLNGGAFQTGTTFTGLAAGSYTITVKNAADCTAVSTITINAVPNAPAVAAFTPIQPTCNTSTGTITIDSPTGAGLTYSLNGGAFQTGTIFTGLAAGAYTITVQNADGCTSITTPVTINAAPATPAIAAFTPIQPTCTLSTGTITIDTPTGAGLTYSLNGGAFQAGTTFAGLAAGAYTITVQNADGCTSVTTPVAINAVPNAPAVAGLILTQPTCTTSTGNINVNTPVGAGLTYSLNGGAFQSETDFAGLAAGVYTITVQNADGCTSVTTPVTINTAPNAPSVARLIVTQPTCTTSTGTITVDTPIGAGLMYSLNGGPFQTGTTFAGLTASDYTLTVQNADGCTSTSNTVTINAEGIPMLTASQGCEGNNYLLTVNTLNDSFDINDAEFEWSIVNGSVVSNSGNTFNITQYVSENNIDISEFPLQFEVTVTTIGGCTNTESFSVIRSFCTIPKGVSPNNDTRNDTFNLIGLNVSKLNIFNRYGKCVYNKTNYTNEWVGQSEDNDDLPTGTYYYVIELIGGETETGWVYLNREN